MDGVLGYNNAVTLLNQACDQVFTDKETYPLSEGKNISTEQLVAVVAPEVQSDNRDLEITMTSKVPSLWLEHEMNNLGNPFDYSYSYPLTTDSYATGTYSVKMSPNHTTYYAFIGAGTGWPIGGLKDAILGYVPSRSIKGILACIAIYGHKKVFNEWSFVWWVRDSVFQWDTSDVGKTSGWSAKWYFFSITCTETVSDQ